MPESNRITGDLWIEGKKYRVDASLTADGGTTPQPSPSPTPPATSSIPAKVIDLANWKLTLPIGSSGKPKEILQPSLASFVDSKYFFVDNEGRVNFWAPVDGVTTSGSSYPRSELRQMTDGTKLASWSLSGRTSMTADLACLQAPVVKPQVSLLQIHGGDDDVCQVLYDGFKKAIGYRVGDSMQDTLLIPNYKFGTRFTAKISVESGKVTIHINNKPMVEFRASGTGCYFKAGAYTQSNLSRGDKAGAGGKVVIYPNGLKVA